MAPLFRALQRAPWVGICLALGLALRVYHYLLCPSVWHDEAALIENALRKGFGELLGPLLYAEAAPPLFLWVERGISLLFGDSVWALRAFPLLASCAALALTAHVARHCLPRQGAPWAVLLLGVSDRALWHSCEAKPYAIDILAASLLIGLFYWPATMSLKRRLVLLTALAPAVIWLSYPCCFLYGGLLVALLPALWRERRWGTWLAYGMVILGAFTAFALLLGPVHAQRHQSMDRCWSDKFPDWTRPWSVPAWVFLSTAEVDRYCFEPTGGCLAVVALIGGVLLWRRGQHELVVLVAVPLALALAASFIHAYPYGGARVEVFAAPGLALLIGAGVPATWKWLRAQHRYATLALVVLLLCPVGLAAFRTVFPWTRPDSAGAAGFVLERRQPDEIVYGNSWQDEYYFRGLGSGFHSDTHDLCENRGRFWLVWTEEGPKPDDASASARLLGGGRILCRRDFPGTTVFLCERRQSN